MHRHELDRPRVERTIGSISDALRGSRRSGRHPAHHNHGRDPASSTGAARAQRPVSDDEADLWSVIPSESGGETLRSGCPCDRPHRALLGQSREGLGQGGVGAEQLQQSGDVQRARHRAGDQASQVQLRLILLNQSAGLEQTAQPLSAHKAH